MENFGDLLPDRLARLREQRSILDTVSEQASTTLRGIGPSDRAKVDQYLDAVRDVERRIQMAESQSDREVPTLEAPLGIPASYEEYAKMMIDLMVVAFQTDLTRVFTFSLARELSGSPSYPEIGISDAHHALTHEARPESVDKVIKINTYHISQLAYFLNKLKSTPDGDGTLLDHITILYGAGISNSNGHSGDNLPLMLVGGGSGRIKGGRHVKYANKPSTANLLLSLMDKMDYPVEKVGESGDLRLDPLRIS